MRTDPPISHSKESVPLVAIQDGSAPAERRLSGVDAPPHYPIFVSQRLLFAIVAFFGFFTTYLMRMCMAIAVVAMVNRTEYVYLNDSELLNLTYTPLTKVNDSGLIPECPASEDKIPVVVPGEFSWDKSIQGYILGGFYWGYMMGQVPSGWLAQKYGGKHVIAICYVVSGVVTLLIPVAARLHYSALIILRVLTGLTQACTFPSMQSVYSQWLPPDERSGLIGFAYSGNQVGGVAAIFLSGLLCQSFNWDSVFYAWGTFCLVWVVFWFFLVFDTPAVHPRINEGEKNYIHYCLRDQSVGHKFEITRLPWRSFALSLPLWAIFITHMLCSFGNSVFYSNIPQYMTDIMNVNMKTNGLYSSLPFIGMAVVTIFGGQASDFLRRKGILTTEWCRKVLTTIGSIGPAIFVIIMVHMGCDAMAGTIALLVVAVALTGFTFGGGYIVNIQDIAPAYSSFLFGIANTLGAVPGFVAPAIVGVLTKNKRRSEWQIVFYICTVLYVIGAAFFLFAAKGVIQPWAKQQEHSEVEANSKKPEDEEKCALSDDTDAPPPYPEKS